MSDKPKTFAVPPPKTVTKVKRPSTVSATPSSSRTRIPQTVSKEKLSDTSTSRVKLTKTSSKVNCADTTISKLESLPEFDAERRRLAYGKFLRAMLEDCLVDEKIEREETQMDVQMGQLADRFQKTIAQLDKTNRRLKDISFSAEIDRLKFLKSKNCEDFYAMTDKSEAEAFLNKLNNTEEAALNKLLTKNINFGYKPDSGHQQLLSAVNDAIEGLEQIKKHSNIDLEKFKQYHESEINIDGLESDRLELESLKEDYDDKYLSFNERLFREASERLAKSIIDYDHGNVDEDDSDD